MKINKKNIEQLYGKEIYCELLLLEYLYESQEGYEMSKLTVYLELNRRTLAKYMEKINSHAIKLYGRECIQFTKRKTYIFNGTKPEYQRLHLKLIEDSFVLVLATKFLSHSYIVFDEFCMSNYLGESTVRRKINVLNEFLNFLNIQIYIQKNKIILKGKEKDIRFSLITFFWNTYQGMEWPFYNFSKDVIMKKIEEFLPSIFKKTNANKRERLLYIFAINILRSQKSSIDLSPKFLLHFDYLVQDNVLFPNFFEQVQTQFLLSNDETKFLFSIMMIFPEYNIYTSPSTVLKKLKIISNDLYENIMSYFKFVETRHPEWNIESEESNDIFAVLLSEFINMELFGERAFSLPKIFFNDQLNTNYPLLFKNIESFIRGNNCELHSSKIKSIVQIYAYCYIMTFSASEFEEVIKIGMNTDMPIYVEKYIEQRLQAVLSSKFNVTFHQYADDKENFDLILNTNLISKKNINCPQLMINEEVVARDVWEIYNTCEEIRLKNIEENYLFS